MLKRINNWHLSVLVVVVSVISLAMIQQHVSAEWVDPTTQPGSTPSNNIVLNPLAEDMQMGSNSIVGTNLTLDGDGTNVVNVTGNGNICLNDTGDSSECIDAWSDVASAGGSKWLDGTAENEIYYDPSGANPKIGIGIDNPEAAVHLYDGNQLKLTSAYIWSLRDDLFKISSSGDVSIRPNNTNTASTTFKESGRVGIMHEFPGYPLHVVDDDSMAVFNIDNEGSYLWTGTRLERDDSEKWYIGMDNGTSNDLLFRNEGTINALALDVESDVTTMTLEGDDKAFVTLSVFDSWDDTVDNMGINFKRNAWQEDQYTDYGLSIKYGSMYLKSYYKYPPDATGTYYSATPLFIKDIGAGTGTDQTAGYVGINNEDPQSQLDVYDDEDMGAAILGTSDSSVGGVGVAGASQNGASARAVGVLGVSDSPAMTGGTSLTAGVFGMTGVSGGVGIYGYQGSGSYAGFFDGHVEIDKGSSSATYALNVDGGLTVKADGENYIQLDYDINPPTGSCNSGTKGRMFFEYSSTEPGKLWICNYTGWESVTLTP